jgi:dethiobiotin synthetase
MINKFFITGTDTDIGKTVVTAGLASVAIAMGRKTTVLKPIQTGTDEYPPDLCEIRRINPEITQLPQDIATAYSYRLPASPHLAAAQEGEVIELNKISETIEKAIELSKPEILLIEGAGGILVPLTEDVTFLDLMQMLKIPVIITASAGLGTINHSLMTIETLKNREIEIAGIIFNRMPAEPGPVEKDNVSIIEKISGIPVLGVIPEIPGDDNFIPNLKKEFLSKNAIKELFGS